MYFHGTAAQNALGAWPRYQSFKEEQVLWSTITIIIIIIINIMLISIVCHRFTIDCIAIDAGIADTAPRFLSSWWEKSARKMKDANWLI